MIYTSNFSMLTFFSKKENTDHTSKEQGKNK